MPRHKWEPGESGNPGGRPKEDPELKELAKKYTKEAIERLAFWLKSDNAKASVMAANLLLERGHGKAVQPIDIPQLSIWDKMSAHDLLALANSLGPQLASIAAGENSSGAAEAEAGTLPAVH